MATVYLALLRADKGFRKLVALKVLRDHPGIELDELREMFAHEARVSARCHHRNVVQIHDVCDLDGKPALCMEYLDGQTYRQVKTRALKTGPLPLNEQVRILAEAAHGLHHVHTLKDYDGRPLGLVHCDVSPENVFITYDGQIKLLDFGIAQAHGDRPAPPGFRGKLSYLAPELIRGEPVDARADVFALGAMLWEAVSVVPFSGGPNIDDRTKLRTRLEGGEPNIRHVQPGTPESLASIIDRAIALSPAQRFADAESFATALEEYLQSARPQPSAQSLSSLVSPMFELERSRQRVIVEPQLQLAHRWDREHESALEQQPLVEGAVSGALAVSGPAPAPLAPPAPFPATPDPFSFEHSYTSAADTVSPDARARMRTRTIAVLAAAAVIGILGGALLGRDSGPRSEPISSNIPPPPAPAATPPAPPPRDEQIAEQKAVAEQARAKAEACVEATHSLRNDLLHNLARDLVRSEAREQRREERREERRARRRAAQCAAGRTDKC